jgi:hypothetical protein
MKTTMQLINIIAKGNYDVIIIGANDDMTPIQAIIFLSSLPFDDKFSFDDTIEKGQLHIY